MEHSPQETEKRIMEVLKRKSAVVDGALARFIPAIEAAEIPELKEYWEMLWDYPKRGGKRLRPAICMLSCEMFGGKEEDAIPTAVAFDLFQHWILIHDDIEDGSELRRGKPCLHRIYGVEKAVNSGDGLHIMMWEALMQNKALLGPTKSHKVMQEFGHQLGLTVEGQAIEINWNMGGRWDMTEKDYLNMIEHKTAHYTGSTPLRLGAIIAGAKARDLEALRKAGLKAGYAFQIVDDALNLAGDVAQYGKEIGGDIYEGKRTMMMIHLLAHAKKERERILEIMNKPRTQKTPEEVKEVIELMNKHGSIDYSMEKARKYAAEAKELFDRKMAHTPGREARETISELIHYFANREK